MTPIILLDRLEEFVREATKDIKLQVRVRNQNRTKKRNGQQMYIKCGFQTKTTRRKKYPIFFYSF
jgi:ribosomal protein S18 acetylase RimI-like enzyme